ncbi:DUF4240 domain-containing protein [Novosphingobium sp. AAP93]|uniref:DUF4240 domain-containing protein n=1 Tax=Novosphingobium sp. AAP93 TaxID=1523427 RepID=UPI0006B9D905|nr:DUF4240 domain-containing protein [Novosphingobium sp. AAP93]KPF88818.1 hypothetical protein IP83_03885 [Novosphingobium sp. AAP93]
MIPPAPDTRPLDERSFWALVDQSAKFAGKPDLQLQSLHTSLSRLPPDRIVEFERVFDQVMRRSYAWDLWGAADLANGGASDDGFEYFRCWLIARGYQTFERVLADPDALADVLARGSPDILEFEDFAYVARKTWAAKTGRDWNEMPFAANMMYAESPKGVRFSDDPAELAKRYPKLWARFGQ